MPKSKLSQVTVSGLATNPNANSLPAGSCAVAENVVSRRPGVLTPCPSSTALVTVPVAAHTTGRALWSDADNAVLAATPAASDPNVWVPGTDETQTGWLTAFTVNQDVGGVQKWQTTQLQIGYDTVADEIVARDIGFLPGLTHCAYSSFRTIVTEKWGSIVSTGDASGPVRWAGLLPPDFVVNVSDAGTWLLDGNSTMYRLYYSIESTNTAKPFEVIGPVSGEQAIYAVTDTATAISLIIRPDEPLVFNEASYHIYVNIFRSSQTDAESIADIPHDFQLVKKQRLTPADQDEVVVVIEDIASDVAREAGRYLYTNPEQQGENSSNYCPPTARDIAVFRDTTFYANRAALPEVTVTVPGLMIWVAPGLFSASDRANGIGLRTIHNASFVMGSTVVTVSDPSELAGVVPGQYAGNYFGVPVYVVAVDPIAGTITLSLPWPSPSLSADLETTDAYTLTAYYADGTSDVYTNPINISAIPEAEGDLMPSLRIYGVQYSYALPGEGRSLTFIATYPAIKRVLYFHLCLTNGQNYSEPYLGDYGTLSEPLVSVVETRPNRLFFSKTGQPEAVPLGNYVDVGAGTILKMAPTQSALLVLATDGLWRVTGDGTSWTVNQVDPTVTLLHPSCLTTLNNQIYGWVEDGLSLIGEDGAQTISTDAVGPDIREWATQIKDWGAPYFWGPSMAGDRFWNEVWLNVHRAYSTGSGGPDHITTLVYNTDTKNFTRLQRPLFANVVYSPDANRMVSSVFISGSPNNIALTVQSDFYDPAGDGWLPVTIWFNALQTEDKGKLKQWMDVNYFVANVQTEVDTMFGTNSSYMHALFDARNESIDPYTDDFSVNSQDMVQLSRDVHFWIPRRAALSDQMQLGLQFGVQRDFVPPPPLAGTHELIIVPGVGFNFQLQGFTVRYRNASDTLKR